MAIHVFGTKCLETDAHMVELKLYSSRSPLDANCDVSWDGSGPSLLSAQVYDRQSPSASLQCSRVSLCALLHNQHWDKEFCEGFLFDQVSLFLRLWGTDQERVPNLQSRPNSYEKLFHDCVFDLYRLVLHPVFVPIAYITGLGLQSYCTGACAIFQVDGHLHVAVYQSFRQFLSISLSTSLGSKATFYSPILPRVWRFCAFVSPSLFTLSTLQCSKPVLRKQGFDAILVRI
mmetsp:Transcript_3568/g.6766  ORF Transcript_3568/g.6766 Transcript_3568/m.6766 type:complete len:231 (+) Transcript_3568:5293-5985(+)